MNCSACGKPMYRHVWIVTQIAPTGVSATANICHACMWASVGRRGVHELNGILGSTGWAQPSINADDGPLRGPWDIANMPREA